MKKTKPELVDHIGWELWQATFVWKRRFTQAMVERGCPWYAEARGGLMRHIRLNGIPQNALAKQAGMTKQAVQQHLDELVKDGIVERVIDENDARRKLVQFTYEGIRAHRIANAIKIEIEEEYLELIGNKAMNNLKQALDLIIQSEK